MFLSHGKTAIMAASYLGAAIPGRLCPMFAYHFTMGDCWPIHMSPVGDLIKDPFTLEQAWDYDPLSIDLYIEDHPILVLITKD
jgi:hypothetical protein